MLTPSTNSLQGRTDTYELLQLIFEKQRFSTGCQTFQYHAVQGLQAGEASSPHGNTHPINTVLEK
jgi:hypothetical protein